MGMMARSDVPLMLSQSRHNMMIGLGALGRESSVDSPKNSLIRLNSFFYSGLQDDQETWNSNLFSAASSPSLVQQRSRSTSRSQTLSGRESSESGDSATQFLNNPMFDYLKSGRYWRRRRAKYRLNSGTSRGESGLGGRCSIM